MKEFFVSYTDTVSAMHIAIAAEENEDGVAFDTYSEARLFAFDLLYNYSQQREYVEVASFGHVIRMSRSGKVIKGGV